MKNDRSPSRGQALVEALRKGGDGAAGTPFPTLLPREPDRPRQLPHQPVGPPQLPHAPTAATPLPHQPSPDDADPDPEC